MGLFTHKTLKSLLVLNILFTGPAFALTKTGEVKEGLYERQQHEYVLSPRNEVAVYCDAGDTLVAGECEGHAESLLPIPRNIAEANLLTPFEVLPAAARDYFNRLIYVDSKEVTENGRAGFACWSKVVRADEEVRISSFAKCKKTNGSAFQRRHVDPAS